MKLRYAIINNIYQYNRNSGKCRLSSMLNSSMLNAVSRNFRVEFQRIVLKRSYNERLLKALEREKKRSNLK